MLENVLATVCKVLRCDPGVGWGIREVIVERMVVASRIQWNE